MAKVIPITEHYQYFLAEMKDTFWGDLYGHTKLAWKRALEAELEWERDRFAAREFYPRRSQRRQPYRNGYYERDFETRLGTIRLRVARTRGESFLPRALEPFQRRAADIAMLIRKAFLRGTSTQQVGRVVATLTGEVVSPQTVSKLTRDLDEAVKQFHQARLSDDYGYLFLDGVSLRVRRPAGRKRVHMLVAYGVRRDGTRHLLAFLRSQGESQADWEGLLQDLYRRGLEGKQLGLIVTDGCPGLAAAIPTVYPRARHQRCWVHKMRNILEKVRKRDYDEVKTGAQAIYLADSRAYAESAFRRFRAPGGANTVPWCGAWDAICRNSCRSSPFPATYGRSCAPQMSSSAASWKYEDELGPWSALSMCKAWTASSTPSSRDSTWNGKPAPSTYLHRQLDVTKKRVRDHLVSPLVLEFSPWLQDFCKLPF
jgi:transposase-like protein